MAAPAAAVGRDPAPQAVSVPKLAVNGVVITPALRAALISVDDRPTTLFIEGQQIVDGVVLYSLAPGGIVVKRGDELLRLQVRGVQSVGNAPRDLPAAESVSTDPPLPPPGTEERRIFQDRD